MQDSQLIGGERPLRRRGVIACLALGLAVLALPSAASAAGPSRSARPRGRRHDPLLCRPLGQANDVTVDLVGSNYVLRDAGVTTFADTDGVDGCSVAGNEATCPATTGTASVALVRIM